MTTAMAKDRTLILGLGNELRGDDALGLVVARRLSAEFSTSDSKIRDWVDIRESPGDATALLELWQGRGDVLVVDALDVANGEPGEVMLFDVTERPLPVRCGSCSTHAFGLGQAVELSRALGSLPRRLEILGAIGATFGMATSMSPPLSDACDKIVSIIMERLTTKGGSPCTSTR